MADVRVIREPHFFGLTINLADGSMPIRVGPEEEVFDQALLSAAFETSLPGGFGPGEFVFPRPDDFDPLSLGRGLWASVRLWDEANRTVYEGRIVSTPKTGVNEITVETEGWAKVTEDNQTAQVVFRDMDMGKWGGASNQRKKDLFNFFGVTWRVFDPTMDSDVTSGTPVMLLEWEGPTGGQSSVIATYDAGNGCRLGSAYALWIVGNNVTAGDANHSMSLALADGDNISGGDSTSVSPIGPGFGTGAVTTIASTHTRRFAELSWRYAIAYAGSNQTNVRVTNLVVYGDHGITPVAVTPGGAEPNMGLLVSDMLAYVFGKFCSPHLVVEADSIEKTNFPVPQSAFNQDTTPRSIIESLLLFGGASDYPLDWVVYDGRKVQVASPGAMGTVWNLRKDEGVPADDSGPDANERPRAVKVIWDDGSGKTLSVAPTGILSDYTDDRLMVTDPNHPALLANLPKFDVVQVGISTKAGATLLGQLYLADRNRQEWRGSISAQGEDGIVRDAAQNEQPVYMIRAADRAVHGDAIDTRERRIVGTAYTSASGQNNLDIGPKPSRFDALLAQAGAVVNPLQGKLILPTGTRGNGGGSSSSILFGAKGKKKKKQHHKKGIFAQQAHKKAAHKKKK